MDSILANFRAIGVELNSDWLAGLELISENTLTNDDVYLALVASDLRESCVTPSDSPLLPSAMLNKSQLPPGSFLFQVTSSEDISIPDAHRPRTAGGSSKRMLKLKLHCGGIEMHASELEPITDLADAPDAGTKIIVSGSPIHYRGLLLLHAGSIRLVGGDVAHLAAAQKAAADKKIQDRDPLRFRKPLAEIINR